MQKRHVLKKASQLVMGSSMLFLSMLPAASAFAATAPTVQPGSVSVSVSSQTSTINGTITAKASVANPPNTALEYQFWIEQPNGSWTHSAFQTSQTYTFTTPEDGDYLVVASAMTAAQLKAQDWSAAESSPADGVFVDSSVNWTVTTSNGSPATDVQPGTTVTVKASATNIYDALYQFWYQEPNGTWVQSGDYSSSNTYSFTASMAGDYKVKVYAKSPLAQNNALGALTQPHTKLAAYGQVAGVDLSAATSTLVADGTATDTITATVIDQYGNVVADFNGTATVSVGSELTPSTGTVTFTNGVGTFTVSGTTTGTDSLTTSALTSTNSIPVPSSPTYATTSVTLVAPVVTALSISPMHTAMLASPSGSTSVTITAVDQLGNPIPESYATGFDVVTLDVSAPGSLSSSTSSAVTSTTEYVAAGVPATATIYDPLGQTGTIMVTASASGLTDGMATITAAPVGLPTQIAVTSTTGTLTSALTSSTNKVTVSSGTTYTQYTVTLEDANGTPVPAPSTETFAITDNATTGQAYLLSNLSSSATLIPASGTGAEVTMSASSSTATFDVVNTTTQSAPALLNISTTTGDLAEATPVSASLSATADAPYTFVVGPAATIDVTGAGDVLENNTATYTAQVADINNNSVPTTGTVTFTLSGTSATFANGSTTYITNLNADGSAQVTVDAGSTPGTYTISASADGVSGMASGTVVALANYVTQLAVTSNGATVPSTGVTIGGLGSATFTVTEENGVDSPITATDNLTVTVSNASDTILENSSSALISGTSLSIPASSSMSFSVLGGTAGTATVTISDASNPSVPSISFPVTVQHLSSTVMAAAGESGAGNSAGDTATISINGSSETATYASSTGDFATYNQQTGEFTVLTPSIMSGTVSGASSPTTLAVWDIGGKYYYLALDESPNVSQGASSSMAYVGIQVTAPTGTVQMAIGSGSYDGNTSGTDYAYIPVAVENSGTWSVATAQSFVLNTQVSLSNGATVVYPTLIQQP